MISLFRFPIKLSPILYGFCVIFSPLFSRVDFIFAAFVSPPFIHFDYFPEREPIFDFL